MKNKKSFWDLITDQVANAISVFNPRAAHAYRFDRDAFRGYSAASTSGSYRRWNPSSKSAQQEVLSGQSRVTAKIRDQERNNPLITGIVSKRTTMVIGDEIGMKPQILKTDGTLDVVLNKQLEELFFDWSEEVTLNGLSLTEAYRQIVNHRTMDGEVMRVDASFCPYKFQIFETDYLVKTEGVYGIDYASSGKPVNYYIYKAHPNDIFNYNAEFEKVQADLVHFLAHTVRSSQHRGISPLASAIQSIYGIDDLENAEMKAARSSAGWGVIVTSPDPHLMPRSRYSDEAETEEDEKVEAVESGAFMYLRSGETAQSFKSERPNSNFDPFIRGRERKISGSAGLSYETATGDYSQVNFASARLARLIEWAGILVEQSVIKKDLNACFRAWLKASTLTKGFPISPRQYAADPKRYHRVTWQLAGNPGIDPNKEISVLEAGLGIGVTSRTNYCAERGKDFLEVSKQIADEKKVLEALGIYQEPPVASRVSEVIDPNAGMTPAQIAAKGT